MKHNKYTSLVLFLALFGWYLLVFFPVPGLLIEGTASLAGLMGLLLLLLTIVLAAYLLRWKHADIPALVVLAAWAFLQFNANWRYWFLEAPPGRAASYNTHFSGTFRIFPPSDTHVVPDAYHIILGLLLFANLVMIVLKITRPVRDKIKA